MRTVAEFMCSAFQRAAGQASGLQPEPPAWWPGPPPAEQCGGRAALGRKPAEKSCVLQEVQSAIQLQVLLVTNPWPGPGLMPTL